MESVHFGADGGDVVTARRRTVPKAAVLAVVGGAAIALGSWLPWMSYFAGLQPLRGVIGLNGRVLFGAGVLALLGGIANTWSGETRVRRFARRATSLLGVVVAAAAVWLLIGVRELTRVHGSNAMFAPRPGVGLVVVLIGGCVLAAAIAFKDEATIPSSR